MKARICQRHPTKHGIEVLEPLLVALESTDPGASIKVKIRKGYASYNEENSAGSHLKMMRWRRYVITSESEDDLEQLEDCSTMLAYKYKTANTIINKNDF